MNIGQEKGVFIFAPLDEGTAPVEEVPTAAPVEETAPAEAPEPVSV